MTVAIKQRFVDPMPCRLELESVCPIFRMTDLAGNVFRYSFILPASELDRELGEKLQRPLALSGIEYGALGEGALSGLVGNRRKDFWPVARGENLDLPFFAYLPDPSQVRIPRPSAGEILRQMAETNEVTKIAVFVKEIADRMDAPETTDLIKEELNRTPSKLPAKQKRALLETLIDASDSQAPDIAFNDLFRALNSGTRDEYVVGCLAALRRARPGSVTREETGRVLGQWLLSCMPIDRVRTSVERTLIRELVLALGMYGGPSDVKSLLSIWKDDLASQFGDQVTSALQRLLMRYADVLGDDLSTDLRETARELLSSWCSPRLLQNFGIFAQTSQALAVLCARLKPAEVRVAYATVTQAKDKSLARRMHQHIQEARSGLLERGYSDWLATVDREIEEVEAGLREQFSRAN